MYRGGDLRLRQILEEVHADTHSLTGAQAGFGDQPLDVNGIDYFAGESIRLNVSTWKQGRFARYRHPRVNPGLYSIALLSTKAVNPPESVEHRPVNPLIGKARQRHSITAVKMIDRLNRTDPTFTAKVFKDGGVSAVARRMEFHVSCQAEDCLFAIHRTSRHNTNPAHRIP
jgi:hypothetical protein